MGVIEGQFVWYDLMTNDVEGAKAFYSETVGWKLGAWDGSADYTMLMVEGHPIGGMMGLPEDVKGAGHPPHWIAYIAVDDVDAKGKEVVALGGKVLEGPNDIPTVGRFSVIADPQGAIIAIFKPEGDMSPHAGPDRVGDYGWHELNTTDWEGAWAFYEKLFGWENTSDMDMGPEMGTYRMYKNGARERDGSDGGMGNTAKMTGMAPSWLYYATVDDVDAAVKRITAKGGKVTNGPMDVPGGDRVAQCVDPQGAPFAIYSAKAT